MHDRSSSLLIYRGDTKSLAVVAFHLSLMAVCMAQFGSMALWQVVLASAILSVSSLFASVIVHNTLHHPIFHRRSLNKIFQMVLSFAQGHPVTAFVPGHNFSHHLHTNTSKDIMRTGQVRFRSNFLNQLLFFFCVLPDVVDSEMRWAKKMRTENPPWFRQWLVETAIVYVVKIALLVFDWKAALFFVWLPHLYGNWGIVGTNMWQHDGCVTGHKYNHSRSITGKALNFFLFNNGFHAAHHMNPGVHWTLLPAYHDEHVAPHAHPSLLQTSLIAYLWHASFRPGKRLDLQGVPVSPPPKEKSVDWIGEVDLASPALSAILGADPFGIARAPASKAATQTG